MINNGRALFSRVLQADTEVQKKPLKKKKFPIIFDEPEFPGLPLGSYEEKRQELAKERNVDYNKFLEEKEKQAEFKRYARKLQSEFGIILPDPADFAASMLTSNNIFGFAPPSYGQHSNGLLSYDNKQTKEEYRQALQQQIDDQKKRKEMEKLKDMQSTQQQPLYQPSFIDGSAHRRPYLMQQTGVINQTSISPSVSVDSLEQVSIIGSIPTQLNSLPAMPPFPQTATAPSLNVNSGLLFGSEPTKAKDKGYYREDLRRQIEEKKRREEEEKARLRIEEECLALRVEQQRLRMLQEYENERQKKLQKEEELRRKQEMLWQLQEQQRKEAEDSRHLLYKRKLEEAEKGRAVQKVQTSELASPTSASSAQTQPAKPEPPSPPTDPRSQVLSQLSLIRQQLHEEKKQKKEILQQKKTYQVMDRADEDDDDITPVLYKTEQDGTD